MPSNLCIICSVHVDDVAVTLSSGCVLLPSNLCIICSVHVDDVAVTLSSGCVPLPSNLCIICSVHVDDVAVMLSVEVVFSCLPTYVSLAVFMPTMLL